MICWVEVKVTIILKKLTSSEVFHLFIKISFVDFIWTLNSFASSPLKNLSFFYNNSIVLSRMICSLLFSDSCKITSYNRGLCWWIRPNKKNGQKFILPMLVSHRDFSINLSFFFNYNSFELMNLGYTFIKSW